MKAENIKQTTVTATGYSHERYGQFPYDIKAR